MKLLVRNLARTTTEEELHLLFEAYGKVQSCTLVMDNKTGISKGFGFVVMPRPGDAKAARKNLNGKLVGGRNIRVKNAAPKKTAAAPTVTDKVTAFNPWTKQGSKPENRE